MTSETLRACPFCGAAPKSAFYGDEDGGYYGVDCCHGFAHQDDEERAIAAWNTRALRPALDVVIEAVEKHTKESHGFSPWVITAATLRALRAAETAPETQDE